MKLDISEIMNRVGTRFGYDINENCDDIEDFVCLKPVTGHIEFTNTGRLIIVRGSLFATLDVECGRCLRHFAIELKAEIAEQHKYRLSHFSVDEGELEEDPVEMEQETPELWEGNLFDLGELIRQTILAELPIRPLCDEQCKGLCPKCGLNYNEGQCNCIHDNADTPFTALGDLLKKKETEK